MARALTAGMPPDMDLTGGYTIRLTAIDPATGNQVTGVTVANLVVAVEAPAGQNVSDLAVGPYLLVPGQGA